MHPLMTAILLGMARLNPFVPDSKLDPPDGELG
jgi:hypothetical protein